MHRAAMTMKAIVPSGAVVVAALVMLVLFSWLVMWRVDVRSGRHGAQAQPSGFWKYPMGATPNL